MKDKIFDALIIIILTILIMLIIIIFVLGIALSTPDKPSNQFCIENGYAGTFMYNDETGYCYKYRNYERRSFAWNGSDWEFEK